jgi:hypothetical protein
LGGEINKIHLRWQLTAEAQRRRGKTEGDIFINLCGEENKINR